MTPAVYTSPGLNIRVALGEVDPVVLFSADHGFTWVAMSPNEARSMAAGLCVAAERADERETEDGYS